MASRLNAITTVFSAAGFVALLLPGCDRKPDAGQPAQDAASQHASAQVQFEVPCLTSSERAALGTALEMKLTGAYNAACAEPESVTKLATLGAMYYVHGHPKESAACFRRITELKPGDPHYSYYLGMAWQAAGQPAEALAAYEGAAGLGPAYEPRLRAMGEVCMPASPGRAIEYYQAALDLDPSDVLAWCGLSRAQFAHGQRDEGLRSILIAANLEPYYADAQHSAAEALRNLGRHAEAEQYAQMAGVGGNAPQPKDPFGESMRRAGMEPRAVRAEAMQLTERGDVERARVVLERARSLPGGAVAATEALGAVAAAEKKWEVAASLFSEVLAADPQAYSAKSSLGEMLIQQGNLSEAERWLREALMEHPEHAATAKRFAALMSQLKKPHETLAVMQAAVAARPFDPVRRSVLAQHYAVAGRTDAALAELRAALDLQPDYFPGRQQLALLLVGERQYAAAKAEFERTLQTNPRYEEAYLYLSTIVIQADKDLRGGERILRDGLKHVPNSHSLANSLAWVLATASDPAQRKPEEAVQLAERAVAATGHTQHSYLDTLGAAYAAAGRFADAARLARQAIEAASRVNAPELEQYRTRLGLYEQDQPFRTPE
ncbi:MAG: tetratricopeptide repeat protein [Phycisphaerae bacterium]|nr:tetratricopeptide repeat protein [Phycisphaerae bacterium]